MKERQRGALARATAVAEGLAAAARRRAQDREPRIMLRDEEDLTFLLKPSARGYDRILDLAERMVELVPATRRGVEPPE